MSAPSHPPINYKTVRLAKGKHRDPEEGVCVMELASMLAREPFSDHPRSVCPVIAALLRAYNDTVDDDRRQDLFVVASRVVGTRADQEVERRRLERCIAWAVRMRRNHSWARRALRRETITPQPISQAEAAAAIAVKAIARHTDATHESVLALVEDLCSLEAAPDAVEWCAPGTDLLASGAGSG
jgi:hypothetical protein